MFGQELPDCGGGLWNIIGISHAIVDWKETGNLG